MFKFHLMPSTIAGFAVGTAALIFVFGEDPASVGKTAISFVIAFACGWIVRSLSEKNDDA